ncbi:hypothetical protein L6452_31040 [Arctium lappa]|uniref:Uncharacterized protein n=1 Tax=Arctium lappa TaxID=4217 RepID=A0ACB8ZKT9_ARCLA|nr:hypothetical protein L6452_31040 [Arctium lappa]
MNIWYPNLEVERRDCKRYIFSEVDFVDLSIDDVDFLYDHFRNLYHRTQDMAVESFQPVVNLERPNRSLQNLESFSLFTIIEDPYGVVYKNNSSEKCFLRFDEVGYYSDGTLKTESPFNSATIGSVSWAEQTMSTRRTSMILQSRLDDQTLGRLLKVFEDKAKEEFHRVKGKFVYLVCIKGEITREDKDFSKGELLQSSLKKEDRIAKSFSNDLDPKGEIVRA